MNIMAWENAWTSEWTRRETLFFLIFLAETRVYIYNTIEQRYACILCFKVCTCTWWYSWVNGIERAWKWERERERAVSLFFFSLFFLIFSFFGRIKEKKIDRKRSRTQIETHFYDDESFLTTWYSEPKKTKMRRNIKNKIKKVRNFEEREMKTSIYYIVSNSLQSSVCKRKGVKRYEGGKKGGEE